MRLWEGGAGGCGTNHGKEGTVSLHIFFWLLSVSSNWRTKLASHLLARWEELSALNTQSNFPGLNWIDVLPTCPVQKWTPPWAECSKAHSLSFSGVIAHLNAKGKWKVSWGQASQYVHAFSSLNQLLRIAEDGQKDRWVVTSQDWSCSGVVGHCNTDLTLEMILWRQKLIV